MDAAAVIKNIPLWDIKKRRELARSYLEASRSDGPNAAVAGEIFDAIWAYETELYRESRKPNGAIEWEPHKNQYIVRGYHDGELVATITYDATHRTLRKEVFVLRMGPDLFTKPANSPYHHIAQAREEAALLFESKGAS